MHHQRETTNRYMEKWSEDEDGVVLAWDDAMDG